MPSKHEVTRLKRELVIWIVTVGRDVHPHAVPVWFWWDGESFLIYAVLGQKVRDMQANPNVALHLNTDPVGEDVVRIDGIAKIDPKHPPASKVAGYLRKYREHIQGIGMTPQEFDEQYHHAIRVRPTRFH
ncbi:MAG TPA: TIGR03667 family PPOX class F420-dependent oxidoreductase [Candidatus Dormibacteraeota bacterium]|nr:TIGR03667 family PPOX class F420-dependent oxidoreductase [Candidatus Dormibacteraeota bacterium]